MGLMDLDNVDDDNEDDLEDELNKLMFGGSKATKKRKNKGIAKSQLFTFCA